jgi:hypothetical protein
MDCGSVKTLLVLPHAQNTLRFPSGRLRRLRGVNQVWQTNLSPLSPGNCLAPGRSSIHSLR